MSDHVGSNLLLQFSEDIMVPITDADEEIFLLYTRLASLKPAEGHLSSPFRGLGFLDASKDLLPVRLDILPRAGYKPPACDNTPTVKGRKAARKRVNRRQEDHSITLELELWQDRTALRSRAGDTGSVLWRASIDFATFILQLARFPYPGALFDSARLAGAHAFELGAGTGLLAATLSPLFRRYTATDMPELVPLLRKNAPSGSHTCALDWTLPAAHQVPDDILSDPADLLLAVDCIYHPSLISPLLNTISSLCLPGRTLVLVMSELRAEDVMRQFLQEWFARAEERWRIWRVEDDSSEATDAVGARYAMWIAWREAV